MADDVKQWREDFENRPEEERDVIGRVERMRARLREQKNREWFRRIYDGHSIGECIPVEGSSDDDR